MKKYEHDVEVARLSAEKFRSVVELFRTAIIAFVTLGCIYLIIDGLVQMVAGQNADGIGALAKVVEALKIGQMFGYMWGAIASVAWYTEREGKKRIVKEKSRLQKKDEAGDAYRSSSGLDETGNTPPEG